MKATLTAYLTSGYDSLESILQAEPDKGISRLTFYHCDMSEHGWTAVGTANIEVTFISPEEATQRRVESLKTQKQKILDEAITKANEIEHQIQELLALPAPDDSSIPF
jgi:hypothetical protein